MEEVRVSWDRLIVMSGEEEVEEGRGWRWSVGERWMFGNSSV